MSILPASMPVDVPEVSQQSPGVHLVWFRAVSNHVWPSPRANILHASQILASLGGPDWSCTAQNVSISLPQLQPKSSSMAVEMREGSNVLSYQQVYSRFEMPVCSWRSAFTVYNHRVRTSWDKPPIEPLRST